jgi:hypothetical protein
MEILDSELNVEVSPTNENNYAHNEKTMELFLDLTVA